MQTTNLKTYATILNHFMAQQSPNVPTASHGTLVKNLLPAAVIVSMSVCSAYCNIYIICLFLTVSTCCSGASSKISS